MKVWLGSVSAAHLGPLLATLGLADLQPLSNSVGSGSVSRHPASELAVSRFVPLGRVGTN